MQTVSKIERRRQQPVPPPGITTDQAAMLLSNPAIRDAYAKSVCENMAHCLIEALVAGNVIGPKGKKQAVQLVADARREALERGELYLRVMAQPQCQKQAGNKGIAKLLQDFESKSA